MAEKAQVEKNTRKKSTMAAATAARRVSVIDSNSNTLSGGNVTHSTTTATSNADGKGKGGDGFMGMDDTADFDRADHNGSVAAAMVNAMSTLMQSRSYQRALHVMERMVNQNDCFDIIDDFKYW
uniref:Uncharacterized protein n=1 Tax=Lygus hesperus TaxID=30085 RepID=A0A146KYX6_LYGHE